MIWTDDFEKQYQDRYKTLDEYQKTAIEMVLKENVSIITGKAGSGKSHVINMLKGALTREGWEVSRTAPTGRAAKRINGMTLHRWLLPLIGIDNYGQPYIKEFQRKTFPEKHCLIIDESSMLDGDLCKKIIDIYNASTEVTNRKIVFVGDPFQLEPVSEPLSPDISKAPFIAYLNILPKTELLGIHRHSTQNDILDFSLAIRDNTQHLPQYNDVSTISFENAILKAYNGTQIIAPMMRGVGGINSINKLIHELLLENNKLGKSLYKTKTYNTKTKTWDIGETIYQHDRIIFNRNNWDETINIMNGTIGYILDVKNIRKKTWCGIEYGWCYPEISCAIFVEDCNYTEYQKTKNKNLEVYIPLSWITKNSQLAYAISVHKAQGSEWDEVILSWTHDQTFMKNNKMLYTAVTRAKTKLHIIT